MPLTPTVRRALRQATRRVGPLLRRALGGGAGRAPCPLLVELGAVTSQPGAAPQLWHADVDRAGPDEKAARIFAVFVALHDVDEAMGPTEVLPGTHGPAFHTSAQLAAGPRGRSQRRPPGRRGPRSAAGLEPRHLAAAARRLAPRPPRRLTLRAGDAAVMDTGCFHRGGANLSDGRRTLLHFAAMEASGAPAPGSFTYTIAEEARSPFSTLAALAARPARPRRQLSAGGGRGAGGAAGEGEEAIGSPYRM